MEYYIYDSEGNQTLCRLSYQDNDYAIFQDDNNDSYLCRFVDNYWKILTYESIINHLKVLDKIIPRK